MPNYNNACYTITSKPTPDPYFCYAHGKFYLTFTANDRIPMWEASSLTEFYDAPRIGPVWRPPPDTKHSARLWAPELHALQGRWYIYYAAQDPKLGNKSHRMYVLGGPPASEDPHTDLHSERWNFLGPIKGMDQRQWAIDGTVIHLDGSMYFVYSGWPLDRPFDDVSELEQQLFIFRLSDPTTAGSSPVMISKPEHEWENSGQHWINEGPQWLASPDDGRSWQGLVYSCGGSWTKEYKMNTLQFLHGDPLNAGSWQKGSKPLIQNSPDGQGPYGPGHGCFMHFGNETVGLFHATDRDTDGNQGRKCRMQRLVWADDGPYMGEVVGPPTRDFGTFVQGKDIAPAHDAGLGQHMLHSPIHPMGRVL